jgi:Skp family chaperone for outer membrane proteins
MKTIGWFAIALLTQIPLACRAAGQTEERDEGEVAIKSDHRLAVVNIGTVFLNYKKAKEFKSEMEQLMKPYQGRAQMLKAEIQKLTDLSTANQDLSKKAQLDDALLLAKRKLEDVDREARQKVGKRQEEHLVALYKEVHAAIKEYADEHGIHLVLGYGELPDIFSFANITRKLSAMDKGAIIPLHFRANLDISMPIVDRLHGDGVQALDNTRRVSRRGDPIATPVNRYSK